jgi:hypothetical protein
MYPLRPWFQAALGSGEQRCAFQTRTVIGTGRTGRDPFQIGFGLDRSDRDRRQAVPALSIPQL